MKVVDSSPLGCEALAGADIFNHGHLPIAAAYCRRLGLVELVDQMVPTHMALRPGLVVQAMVLDTLSGRTPLYRLEGFLASQDVELLLGEPVPAHAFNDTNLARSLDAMFAAGTSKIVTELGLRATSAFRLDTTVPSYDTTSTSVWGDYRACELEEPPPGPRVTHGHSKDHLSELKQFMTELLCVDRGVPIFGRTLDGNSSDKTSNNQILSRIGSIMARHGLGPGAFVYVADAAMVTEKNLDVVGPNRFVSRLPAIYAECGRVIAKAVDTGAWTDIGPLAENAAGPARPCAEYRTFETSVVLYGKTYRAVVVHSSSLHIQILLGFMALARIRRPEGLRHVPPGELGKVVGLDRVPEVRTLREKIAAMTQNDTPQKWMRELSRAWMEADPREAGYLLYGWPCAGLPRLGHAPAPALCFARKTLFERHHGLLDRRRAGASVLRCLQSGHRRVGHHTARRDRPRTVGRRSLSTVGG